MHKIHPRRIAWHSVNQKMSLQICRHDRRTKRMVIITTRKKLDYMVLRFEIPCAFLGGTKFLRFRVNIFSCVLFFLLCVCPCTLLYFQLYCRVCLKYCNKCNALLFISIGDAQKICCVYLCIAWHKKVQKIPLQACRHDRFKNREGKRTPRKLINWV